jgi:hypothetical protein
MANKETAGFPMLPIKHWWALRNRFKKSIPGTVSPSYIAAALGMKEESARANVILPLRALGLVDEDNRTNQDLAVAWRDDQRYADACQEMAQHVYPEDLIEAVPNPTSDREAAERWFANRTGAGTAAVKRMAALYAVIGEPYLSEEPTGSSKTTSARAPRPTSKRSTRAVPREAPARNLNPMGESPGIAINLQIHISSDATSDQIDAIFESMAKHIYKK